MGFKLRRGVEEESVISCHLLDRQAPYPNAAISYRQDCSLFDMRAVLAQDVIEEPGQDFDIDGAMAQVDDTWFGSSGT